MDSESGTRPSKLRALLVLGRVSNLPTVWSNCLAGWWLAGGGPWEHFFFLCFGATLIYVGGMYLNDACDVDFDRRHRQERPIPSNAVSEKEVWIWTMGLLSAGTFSFFAFGTRTACFAVLLLFSIVVYNVYHKRLSWSPILMALCRLFLVIAAASAASAGGPPEAFGLAIWSAIVLALYIVGLTYIAKHESLPGLLRFWPCIFLAAPIVLATIVNREGPRMEGAICSIVMGGWVIWCLTHTFAGRKPRIGKTVSGLLAGIVLVDLLAVVGGLADGAPQLAGVFALLFVLALFFQKFIPAT
jgi:hypothetical protein